MQRIGFITFPGFGIMSFAALWWCNSASRHG